MRFAISPLVAGAAVAGLAAALALPSGGAPTETATAVRVASVSSPHALGSSGPHAPTRESAMSAQAAPQAPKRTEDAAVMVGEPIRGEKVWDAGKLGRRHVTTAVTYPMKPPVGGDHHPVWMNCDGIVYDRPIREENAVHSLEHGAVWVTYNDRAPAADVHKLEDKVRRIPYAMMSPVKDQAGPVMLSAWGRQLTVGSADDPRVDQFLTKYVQGPQTPEPGATCAGGLTA
ncbi:DUF3105 domain-containing protein [Streptomyces sp. NPDC127084]|uniref:DUF3105 domain-containing protein n=1 Tax=Streptomyces sp. NPDC127084 TaxID=3347133 RepID=UPI003665C442